MIMEPNSSRSIKTLRVPQESMSTIIPQFTQVKSSLGHLLVQVQLLVSSKWVPNTIAIRAQTTVHRLITLFRWLAIRMISPVSSTPPYKTTTTTMEKIISTQIIIISSSNRYTIRTNMENQTITSIISWLIDIWVGIWWALSSNPRIMDLSWCIGFPVCHGEEVSTTSALQ